MDQRFARLFQCQKISLSELARRSLITPGYLSKILRGKTPNVSLSILARISEHLDLTVDELFKMIKEKDYEPTRSIELDPMKPQRESFDEAVQHALDAIEQNDSEGFKAWSEKIRQIESPLRENYERWVQGLLLFYENQYETAKEHFLFAQNYKAQTLTERRLKAKIQSGLATTSIGQGDYPKALLLLRKSLMNWDEGVHAGTVYLNMGTLNRRKGDFLSAELCYRSALLIPIDYIQLLSYAGLGQIYLDQGKFHEARATLLQGYCISKKVPEPRGKGELFCNLGKYYKEKGMTPKAISQFKKGLRFATDPLSKRTRLYLLTELMDASASMDQNSSLEPWIHELNDEEINTGDILLIGSSLLTHAKKHMQEGHLLQALPLLNQCFRLLTPIAPSYELLTCCTLLSDYYFQTQEPFQSHFYSRESKRLQKALKSS